MRRERGLKVVLILVGLLFTAAIYPAVGGQSDPTHSDTGDTIMMGLYFALGIFLLLALRNPSAHRSLIAFAVWSSFAHAAVMSVLGFEIATERTERGVFMLSPVNDCYDDVTLTTQPQLGSQSPQMPGEVRCPKNSTSDGEPACPWLCFLQLPKPQFCSPSFHGRRTRKSSDSSAAAPTVRQIRGESHSSEW